MYLIQHYEIKFVSHLWQVGGFLQVLQFPSPIKLNNLNIVESGIKHNNLNTNPLFQNEMIQRLEGTYEIFKWYIIIKANGYFV